MHVSAGTASQPPTVAMEPDPNICRFHSCPVHNLGLSLSPSLPSVLSSLSLSLSLSRVAVQAW